MRCTVCAGDISQDRIAALPATQVCIACAQKNDVQKTIGYMSWEHKTAPYIILGSHKAITELLRMSRKRLSAQLPFATRGSHNTVVCSMQSADSRVASSAHSILLQHPARCHPLQPRVGPSGLCVECAVRWYAARIEWK